MALPKFSELLFRINNPGVAPEKVSDRGIFESATYSYNDDDVPPKAALTTGYEADDIHYPSVKAHMKNKGVPEDHANAIVAHLKNENENENEKGSGYTDSNKKGFDVQSTHGNFVVHSSSNSETGKTKFHVSDAMKNEEFEQVNEISAELAMSALAKRQKQNQGPMSNTDFRKVKRGGNPVDTEHDTFRRAMKKPGAAAARFTAVYGPSKEKK